MNKPVSLLFIVLLFAGTIWAKDTIVVANGPIQAVYNSLRNTPGSHRILLQDGIYNLTSTLVLDTGRAGPIRIRPADTTKRPIIMAMGREVFKIHQDSVTIEGLEIITNHTGIFVTGLPGVLTSARAVTVSRCHIHPPPDTTIHIGIRLYKADSATVDYPLIVNNLITDVATSGIQCVTTLLKPPLLALTVFHNTILMDSIAISNYAIDINGPLNVNARFVNNAFFLSDSAHIRIVMGGVASYNLGMMYFDTRRTGTPFINTAGTPGFTYLAGYVVPVKMADPRFGALRSVCHGVGRPLFDCKAIDTAATGLSPAVTTDLYGKPRGAKPDIGAIEYDPGYVDSIYVSPTGSDSATGDRGRPVRTVLFAFGKKVPNPLAYPVVIRLATGEHPGFSLSGKTINAGASVRVASEDDANRAVIKGAAEQAVAIEGNSIHIEGLVIKVSSGVGVRIKGPSRDAGIHRCFIRPDATGSMSKAVEINSAAGAIANVRVENCLIDFKEYTGSTGAICISQQGTNRIDSVYVIYNSIYLENRAGECGVRISSATAASTANLIIFYNLFDSPRQGAIVVDNPVGGMVYKNYNNNSPLDTAIATGPGSLQVLPGNLGGSNVSGGPAVVTYLVDMPSFMMIDSLKSLCRGMAGANNDGFSPVLDYAGKVRAAFGVPYSIGAYVPMGKLVVATPENHLVFSEVSSDRRDRFHFIVDSLQNYSTNTIGTLGIWWFPNSVPSAASVDMGNPFRTIPFTQTMQENGSYTDSLISPAFEPGKTYYFLASVRTRPEYDNLWAPIDTTRAGSGVCYVDNIPPPNHIHLTAESIAGVPNVIRLRWQADADLIGTDADSVGLFYKYSGSPDSAGDPSATRVGVFPISALPCSTLVQSLQQDKQHYFGAFVRDSVDNWSGSGAFSRATAKTPKANDLVPPVNGLTIQLEAETTGTSIRVSWSWANSPERRATVGVTYSSSAYLEIPANRPNLWAQTPAENSQIVIKGLERGVLYYFALSVADSVSNWAASTEASKDSIRTYVGAIRICTLFTSIPDTVAFEYEKGQIRIGWEIPDAGTRVEVKYFDNPPSGLARPSSNHLLPLSHSVHFDRPLDVLGSVARKGIFLSIPIDRSLMDAAVAAGTPEATIWDQARLYHFVPGTPDTWTVVYTSKRETTSMTAGTLTDGGYYRVMWDLQPPTTTYNPASDSRWRDGIPVAQGFEIRVPVSDAAISNCMGYMRYGPAGRKDSAGLSSETVSAARGNINFHVSANQVTERGVYASLTITDGVHSIPLNFSFPVTFPALSSEPLRGGDRWNFFSVPASTDNGDALNIFGSIGDGKYDNYKWRLFRYENGGYAELNPDVPGPASKLEPGKGYWIVLRDEKAGWDFGSGRTVSAGTCFQIPLVSTWNDFGIPFNFQGEINGESDSGICLGDVIDSSQGLGQGQFWIYGYDSTGWVPLFNPLTSQHFAGRALLPWKGYAVFTIPAVTLRIPAISRYASQYRNSAKMKPANPQGWEITARAQWKSGRDAAYAGLRFGSKGLPPYAPKPSGPGDEVSLSLKYETDQAKSFPVLSLFADSLGEGNTWVYCLKNLSNRTQDVALAFDENGPRPSGMQVVLWNPAQTPAFKVLDAGAGFDVRLARGDSLEFRILAGSGSYLAQWAGRLDLPAQFAPRNCGPNPFNPGTVIGFDIPFAMNAPNVLVEIRDSRGRRVTTLFKGTAAGRYRKAWDARACATGVYFVHMRARQNGKEIFRNVNRLVLLK